VSKNREGHEMAPRVPGNVDESRWIERPELTDRLIEAYRPAGRVALVGPPGAGKSFLARRFYDYLDRVNPNMPLLSLAMDAHAPDEQAGALLRELGVDPLPDPSVNVQRLRHVLRQQGPGVLLLDNATDASAVRGLLPPEDANWFVLVTCQNRSVLDNAFGKPIDVTAFTPDQALELFRRRLGDKRYKEEQDEIAQLCQDLGNLPIAVAAAAGAIGATQRPSVADWRARFNTRWDAFDQEARPGDLNHPYATERNLADVVLRMALEDLSAQPGVAGGNVWPMLGALALFESSRRGRSFSPVLSHHRTYGSVYGGS